MDKEFWDEIKKNKTDVCPFCGEKFKCKKCGSSNIYRSMDSNHTYSILFCRDCYYIESPFKW